MAIKKPRRSPKDKPSQDTVSCYVKWLQLKHSKEYRESSEKIRRLQEFLDTAEERFRAAHHTYVRYLGPDTLDSPEKQAACQQYWTTEESAKKAQEALTAKTDETCNKFGLFQWWDPDDANITLKDARDLFALTASVEVLDPIKDKMVDLHAEARRSLEREGTWLEPPYWKTKLDKEGCLAVKIRLNDPIEEIERAFWRLVDYYRQEPPKTRRRPDKVAQALDTWVCYEEHKVFSVVAQRLGRKVSTVKGQYVRACTLIHGQQPTGSIKRRRAGIVSDPAGEFQNHLGSCSRCQKAETGDEMCAKFKAFVTQDTKSLREVPKDPSTM